MSPMSPAAGLVWLGTLVMDKTCNLHNSVLTLGQAHNFGCSSLTLSSHAWDAVSHSCSLLALVGKIRTWKKSRKGMGKQAFLLSVGMNFLKISSVIPQLIWWGWGVGEVTWEKWAGFRLNLEGSEEVAGIRRPWALFWKVHLNFWYKCLNVSLLFLKKSHKQNMLNV